VKHNLLIFELLALRAQTVDIAYLPLRQGFFGKKRFNDRSKGFLFGQQPVKRPHHLMAHVFAFFSERLYDMDEELSQESPFMTNDVAPSPNKALER